MKNPIQLQEMIEQKIYNVIDNKLKKFIKPSFSFNEVKDIDLEIVKKLKKEYGIGGIILDVDETLRKDMMTIPNCNKEWIEFMKKEFKVIILSNGVDKKIKEYAKESGIGYIGFAKKPLRRGFFSACEMMGLEPENVLVIGNDIICDIYGGNRSGMLTALINDVNSKKQFER